MLFVWIMLAILVADSLRSAITIAWLNHTFYRDYKPQRDNYVLGKGPKFVIVLLGDSGIDGHGDNTVKFGPAYAMIMELAKLHEVEVRILAKESSRTYDVINKQLPKLKEMHDVDMVFVYMGANNVIRLESLKRAKADYDTLLDYTYSKDIPLVASAVASYWMLSMFSLFHKAGIYYYNNALNRYITKLPAKYPNFVLFHEGIVKMTRRMISKDYMADRLHPNDKSLKEWSEVVLSVAKTHPKTKSLFADIINR